jgi:transcription initiation factor TFIIB
LSNLIEKHDDIDPPPKNDRATPLYNMVMISFRLMAAIRTWESVCPECMSNKLVTDPETGEVVCQECGAVVIERGVDTGPEWRNPEGAGEKPSKSRGGPPVSIKYGGMGLTTTFDWMEDFEGKKLTKEAREKMRKLQRFHETIKTSEERNLQQAASVLAIYADKLNLPQPVAEQAMLIYRKALKAGLLKGRAIRVIMAGAVYAACRLSGLPRDLRDFERAYPLVKRKEVGHAYRLIVKTLNIKPPVPPDPSAYVPKIAAKLGVEERTIREALSIIEEAKKRGGSEVTAGKDPVGVAAAALYIACQETMQNVMQKKIASVAGVTEVTVRNRVKMLQLYFQNNQNQQQDRRQQEVTQPAG